MARAAAGDLGAATSGATTGRSLPLRDCLDALQQRVQFGNWDGVSDWRLIEPAAVIGNDIIALVKVARKADDGSLGKLPAELVELFDKDGRPDADTLTWPRSSLVRHLQEAQHTGPPPSLNNATVLVEQLRQALDSNAIETRPFMTEATAAATVAKADAEAAAAVAKARAEAAAAVAKADAEAAAVVAKARAEATEQRAARQAQLSEFKNAVQKCVTVIRGTYQAVRRLVGNLVKHDASLLQLDAPTIAGLSAATGPFRQGFLQRAVHAKLCSAAASRDFWDVVRQSECTAEGLEDRLLAGAEAGKIEGDTDWLARRVLFCPLGSARLGLVQTLQRELYHPHEVFPAICTGAQGSGKSTVVVSVMIILAIGHWLTGWYDRAGQVHLPEALPAKLPRPYIGIWVDPSKRAQPAAFADNPVFLVAGGLQMAGYAVADEALVEQCWSVSNIPVGGQQLAMAGTVIVGLDEAQLYLRSVAGGHSLEGFLFESGGCRTIVLGSSSWLNTFYTMPHAVDSWAPKSYRDAFIKRQEPHSLHKVVQLRVHGPAPEEVRAFLELVAPNAQMCNFSNEWLRRIYDSCGRQPRMLLATAAAVQKADTPTDVQQLCWETFALHLRRLLQRWTTLDRLLLASVLRVLMRVQPGSRQVMVASVRALLRCGAAMMAETSSSEHLEQLTVAIADHNASRLLANRLRSLSDAQLLPPWDFDHNSASVKFPFVDAWRVPLLYDTETPGDVPLEELRAMMEPKHLPLTAVHERMITAVAVSGFTDGFGGQLQLPSDLKATLTSVGRQPWFKYRMEDPTDRMRSLRQRAQRVDEQLCSEGSQVLTASELGDNEHGAEALPARRGPLGSVPTLNLWPGAATLRARLPATVAGGRLPAGVIFDVTHDRGGEDTWAWVRTEEATVVVRTQVRGSSAGNNRAEASFATVGQAQLRKSMNAMRRSLLTPLPLNGAPKHAQRTSLLASMFEQAEADRQQAGKGHLVVVHLFATTKPIKGGPPHPFLETFANTTAAESAAASLPNSLFFRRSLARTPSRNTRSQSGKRTMSVAGGGGEQPAAGLGISLLHVAVDIRLLKPAFPANLTAAIRALSPPFAHHMALDADRADQALRLIAAIPGFRPKWVNEAVAADSIGLAKAVQHESKRARGDGASAGSGASDGDGASAGSGASDGDGASAGTGGKRWRRAITAPADDLGQSQEALYLLRSAPQSFEGILVLAQGVDADELTGVLTAAGRRSVLAALNECHRCQLMLAASQARVQDLVAMVRQPVREAAAARLCHEQQQQQHEQQQRRHARQAAVAATAVAAGGGGGGDQSAAGALAKHPAVQQAMTNLKKLRQSCAKPPSECKQVAAAMVGDILAECMEEADDAAPVEPQEAGEQEEGQEERAAAKAQPTQGAEGGHGDVAAVGWPAGEQVLGDALAGADVDDVPMEVVKLVSDLVALQLWQDPAVQAVLEVQDATGLATALQRLRS